MNRSRQPLTNFLLALVAALLLAILATLLVHRKPPVPAPNIDSLKDSLKRTAEASLPAPTVTNDQITVNAKDGSVDSTAETVVKQSATCGGTALKTLDADGSVRLLVQIPGTNGPRFRELVTGKPAPAASAAAEESQLIEVIVTK
jgi:hypothetical protein